MAVELRLKELSKKEDLFTHGHRMCSGCGAPIAVKMVLFATDYPVIACSSTGCLEVSSCISLYTSWKIPWIHSAFENAAYMNTGIQRSSATPLGAETTTSPAGTVVPGKTQERKNLSRIMAAHDIPYTAQASIR